MSALQVGIVGGGISGLLLAQHLSRSGASPTIIDKAVRLGGRFSARPVGHSLVPTSVRSFNVRDDQIPDVRSLFDETVVRLTASEVNDSAADSLSWRFGVDSFEHITKISQAFDRVHGLVTHVAPTASGRIALQLWANGPTLTYDAVVLTPPGPQLVELLRRSEIKIPNRLQEVRYSRQLVFIGSGRKVLPNEPHLADDFWSNVYVKKTNKTDEVSLAAYASHAVSERLWEQDATATQADLATALHSSVPDLQIDHGDVKRWRYANALHLAARDCGQALQPSLPMWACGDGLGGPSGTAWGVSRALSTAAAARDGLLSAFSG